MADVGHAGADEDVVHFGAGNFREEFHVVGVVGAGHDGLGHFVQVDFDDFGVFGVGVGFDESGVLQPLFDVGDALLKGLGILVAVFDHLLHEGDVGLEVGHNACFGELDAASGGGALGGGVGQFEGLFYAQLRQAFHFQDAAVEAVDLAGFGYGQQALLDGVVGDGVDHVAQGDAFAQFAFEAHQYGLGHIQGHEAQGTGEGDEAGTGGEGDADGEAGVGVTAGSHGVGDEQAVEPGVDNSVGGAQGYAAALGHEVWQVLVHGHVSWLGVSGGVAEGLHVHVGLEFEAGQFLQLVGGHHAGGVLGADGGHFGFAGGSGQYAGQAAGFANDFLSLGIALASFGLGVIGLDEQVAFALAQQLAGTVGEGAANDQGYAATGAVFVFQGAGVDLEGAQGFAGFVLDGAFNGIDGNHITHFQFGNVAAQGQGAGILGGVEEDRRDGVADDNAAAALVGDEGDVFADVPQQGVTGGFTGRAGAHDVAHEGHAEAFSAHLGDLLQAAGEALVPHAQGVQGDVGAAPGFGSGGEIVGVDFAVHAEDFHFDFGGEVRFAGEPLGVGPGLHHALGSGVGGGQLVDAFQLVKDKHEAFEGFGGFIGQAAVLEQVNQVLEVIATQHGAQHFHGVLFGYDGRAGLSFGDFGQEIGFYFGSRVNTGGNAIAQERQQEFFFARRRVLQHFTDTGGLLGSQRFGRNALGTAFLFVLEVGFNH